MSVGKNVKLAETFIILSSSEVFSTGLESTDSVCAVVVIKIPQNGYFIILKNINRSV